MTDQVLAPATQLGDREFRELTDPYRRELQVHCYRILGSAHDAEDMLQETLLSAWRSLDQLETRSAARAWLYRIATNRCLNALRDSKRRPQEASPRSQFPRPEPTATESDCLEPYPDTLLEAGPEARYEHRETIELAFIAALQTLPGRQRASLVLREVLGFSTEEVAAILDSSEDSVKAALKRARATLEQRLPNRERAPLPNSQAERELTRRFADAFERDDVDAIVALLTEDAWLIMPPIPLQYQGRELIGEFWRGLITVYSGRANPLVPTRANTQPAFACFTIDPGTTEPRPSGMLVLTLAGDRISAISRFLDPAINAHFGLAELRS